MKEISRRVNYFSAAFLSILGFSLASEIFMEDDFMDKIDDILFVLLGVAVIFWYKKTGHRARSSVPSVIFVGIGLLIKIGAIIIEHADKEAVGDDIGVTIGLFLAFLFVAYQTFSKKLDQSS